MRAARTDTPYPAALDMTVTADTHNRLPPRGQRGFTLIEVLIALVIMSVGMLGIAGLYVHSMQAGRTSLFRHHAVILAGDVADRIRANPNAAAAYTGAGANSNCVNGGINCTPAQMAAHDIWLWEQQAAETLPNGDVTVVFDNAVVPPTYEIAVSWEEPGQNLDYTIEIPVFGM
ncbi:MAG: type IV pilus modification protein PilV [Woeseiaceae bacterium]|nr:type IV pilus modification protein PilV [Woeseiaceae bacterium]